MTSMVIGTLKDLPTEASVRGKLELRNLNLNSHSVLKTRPITFGDLAKHYITHELPADQSEAAIPKAHSTITTYTRYLNRWILPRWSTEIAASMEPIDVQNWLKQLGKDHGLSNQTRAKIRQTMSLVYTHGMRYGLLPRAEGSNPVRYVRQSCVSDYEPVILTPSQCFAILKELKGMHRVLVLTAAATALRISEILALRWMDVDGENQRIHVRRAWVYGKFGPPKSKASKNPAPLHPVLAAVLEAWKAETPYAKDADLVFPSFKLKGKKPPRANMLVSEHLKPAAIKAGIKGEVGFHTFRRTLASTLIANSYDPKLVQELLRHSNIKTTLDVYARAITPAKIDAQGVFLRQMLGDATPATA